MHLWVLLRPYPRLSKHICTVSCTVFVCGTAGGLQSHSQCLLVCWLAVLACSAELVCYLLFKELCGLMAHSKVRNFCACMFSFHTPQSHKPARACLFTTFIMQPLPPLSTLTQTAGGKQARTRICRWIIPAPSVAGMCLRYGYGVVMCSCVLRGAHQHQQPLWVSCCLFGSLQPLVPPGCTACLTPVHASLSDCDCHWGTC